MRSAAASGTARWFQRLVLPGLAFKAVVIGGGYATGREIAEFFLPAGAWGGLAAMALATAIWSSVAALTFLLAHRARADNYRTFFKILLGRYWIAFEIAYAFFIVLVLAVFGAAAGEIGHATLGVPKLAGTFALMASIAVVVAFGNDAVERLFAWVSVLLYGVYILFFGLALTTFGDRIGAAFAAPTIPTSGWAAGGITYAAYNIVGAVIILPVLRHLGSDRDAVVAGLGAGVLAMLPAVLFFVCMTAFMPEIAAQALPSDDLLTRIGQPWFRYLFQLMIFAALLESGTGAVHAINERIAGAAHGRPLTRAQRGIGALVLLAVCMLVAERVGLVALIAGGYRLLAWTVLAVYVIPLATRGLWLLFHPRLVGEVL
ncbi:hypothetical protein KX816_04580 [Sphingosinicellaceae bacterium]|nr:hypothetical protein KX816_04580 [Sphingosinicellaceae bacterium]